MNGTIEWFNERAQYVRIIWNRHSATWDVVGIDGITYTKTSLPSRALAVARSVESGIMTDLQTESDRP
jgi:hypothetical protein